MSATEIRLRIMLFDDSDLILMCFIVNFMLGGTIKITAVIKLIGGDLMVSTFYENFQRKLRRYLRSVQLYTDRRFLLEMNSEGELRVTGITDIRSYDEWGILVISRSNITEIKGSELVMNKFSESEISVCGKIDTVNFMRR